MSEEKQEKGMARLFVDEEFILSCIQGFSRNEVIEIPWQPPQLPGDTQIRGIYYQPEKRGFDIMLESVEFEKYALGEIVTCIGNWPKIQTARFAREDLEKLLDGNFVSD